MNVDTRLARAELALNLRSEVLEELDVAVNRFGPVLDQATREVLLHDAVLADGENCTALHWRELAKISQYDQTMEIQARSNVGLSTV